jgi:hypothetical protein
MRDDSTPGSQARLATPPSLGSLGKSSLDLRHLFGHRARIMRTLDA